MGQQASNPHEANARLWKAMRLARWIERQCREGGTEMADCVDVITTMSSKWWQDAALAAGVKPPSSTTIELVVRLLREEVEKADQDPFEGLPGNQPSGGVMPELKGCCG